MYPRVVIDLKKYEHNVIKIKEKLKGCGISYTLVTKMYCAFPELAEVGAKYADYFGDSRVDNLKKLAGFDVPKIMIRIPMQSEIQELVQYADISCVSELSTVALIDKEAEKQGKIHKLILMNDLGDLREGYFYEEELLADTEKIVRMKNVEIIGVGVNLCCFGGIMATPDNLSVLIARAEKLKSMFGLKMEIISGGASTSIYLIDRGVMPEGINNLRIGDCAVTGNEYNYDYDYEDMYQDVMTFEAEIVEMKRKPSIPAGEQGMDAFMQVPVYEDRGVTKRALLACGRQDIDHTQLKPADDKIIVLGASSDHLIVDIEDSANVYNIGDVLSFRMGYSAILRVNTSAYVRKVFLK